MRNNNEELGLDEIKLLIRDFILSRSDESLRQYFTSPSTWEITSQARKEISHTRFLSWFFNNSFGDDVNNSPFKKLLVLLWNRSEESFGFFPKDLNDSLYSMNMDVVSFNAEAEHRINGTGISYGEGSIDILITGEINLGNVHENNRTVHVCIENKIDSPETFKYFDSFGKQVKQNKSGCSVKYQTDAYYEYICKEYPNDLNIFVYLKPIADEELDALDKPQCHNNQYIQINYQQLLDYIIEPTIKNEKISVNDKYLLCDYILALCKPLETENDRITIMATPNERKKLLNDFFTKNEDLIRAAIKNLNDSELNEALENTPRTGQRVYSVGGEGSYSNVEVLEIFAKKLMDEGKKIEEVNDEIKKYIHKKSTNRVYLSEESGSVYREDVHCHIFSHNNQSYKITKEWSDKESKNNFWKVREGINANHSDFQITKLN